MSSIPEEIKREIEAVAVDAVETFVEEEGITHDQGLELLVDTIDALLPLGAILRSPIGASLERADGPAIEAILRAIAPILKPNPEQILKRAQRAQDKGRDKRAARLRRRAKRVAERQAEDG